MREGPRTGANPPGPWEAPRELEPQGGMAVGVWLTGKLGQLDKMSLTLQGTQGGRPNSLSGAQGVCGPAAPKLALPPAPTQPPAPHLPPHLVPLASCPVFLWMPFPDLLHLEDSYSYVNDQPTATQGHCSTSLAFPSPCGAAAIAPHPPPPVH